MAMSFGARLRAQRERQQVTLTAIEEQSKIRRQLLEELEGDSVAHWPQGIFRRAYLRHYARAIGLNPEDTLREFLELYPDPIDDAEAAIAAHAEASNGRPRTRLRYLFESAIGSLPLIGQSGQKDGVPSIAARPVVARSFTDDSSADDGAFAAPGTKVVARAVEGEPLVDVPPAADVAVVIDEMSFAEDLPCESPRLEMVSDVDLDGDALEAPAITADTPAAPVAADIDLAGMASLCHRLAQTRIADDVAPLLADAAQVLQAVGIIVWMWSPKGALAAALSHGYPQDMLAKLPMVRPEADNAIAAAFRSVETRVVESGSAATGAVVVPVCTPSGCAGVLALEFRRGDERRESLQALAGILAAQLSVFVDAPPLARSAIA